MSISFDEYVCPNCGHRHFEEMGNQLVRCFCCGRSFKTRELGKNAELKSDTAKAFEGKDGMIRWAERRRYKK